MVAESNKRQSFRMAKFNLRLRLGLSLVIVFIATSCLVQASFWRFYMPNFLKPTGYSEITEKIRIVEERINKTKDNYSDIKYYWKLMKGIDGIEEDELYPEPESACAEIFPMFRDLATEYSAIDYFHYVRPLEDYRTYLIEKRKEWFPALEESKNILPGAWEQNLLEKEVQLKLDYHTKLTDSDEYKVKREKLLEIWKTAKRSLDSSLKCVYLRYAFRQVSEDINQLALETNKRGMEVALNLIRAAYKRIEKLRNKDQNAIAKIHKEMEKEARFEIED